MKKSKDKNIDTAQTIRRYMKHRKSATIGDLRTLGFSHPTLFRALAILVDAGDLVRVEHGRYQLKTEAEADSWVLLQRQYPNGVICLLSALAFHRLTTQSPHEAWVAIPKGARRKLSSSFPLRIVRLSGPSLTAGVEVHSRHGGTVRVYSAAKTVADCFKFRSQVGLDLALKVLRDGWQKRYFTLSELDQMARSCRVQVVMRPYVEALLT